MSSILFISFLFCSSGCSNVISVFDKDTLRYIFNRYDKFENRDGSNYKGGGMYPLELTDNMQINNYFSHEVSSRKNNWYTGKNSLLDITYTEEDYVKEIERLESYYISHEYKGEQFNAYLLYDKDCVYFNYAAYIYSYYFNGDGARSCEYVLLLGNNRIAYIYLNDVTEKALRMDKSYVPKDYYDGYKMGGQTSVSYCAYSDFSAYEYYHKIYPEGLEWLI